MGLINASYCQHYHFLVCGSILKLKLKKENRLDRKKRKCNKPMSFPLLKNEAHLKCV